MRTQKEMSKELKEKWFCYFNEYSFQSPAYPSQFAKIMRENTGMAAQNTVYGLDKEGFERKNPVISVLGDSISAGHFEWAISEDEVQLFLAGKLKESRERHLEVVDLREVYHEQFRMMLADYYGNTSVSVINAGIAGDTLIGMKKRLKRDVLSHNPDLIIWNGCMNWNDCLGSAADYGKLLENMIEEVRETSDAEIILMTPNLSVPIDPSDESKLRERVGCVRNVADKYRLCLADLYAFWDEFCKKYHPNVREMLANGINHPTAAGHTVYAACLMQLIREADKFS